MTYKNYLIVHIGGASMSGLAKILFKSGQTVYGWERRIQIERVQELIKMGIKIFSNEIPLNILNTIECVVHSSITNSEYIRDFFGFSNGIQIYSQFKFINLLIKDSESIAITGSFGKTITTTLLSHVLYSLKKDISFTCGGISKNFNSNAKKGNSNIWIVEAVETHENCLQLNYTFGIILNIENYSQIQIFEKFIKNAKEKLFINSDDVNCKNIISNTSSNVVTFGIDNATSDLQAININFQEKNLSFDVNWKQSYLGSIKIPNNGFFSIYNVLAVIAISIYFGINILDLNNSFKTYLGVQKRFDIIFKTPQLSLIIDIAHHPAAIKESIKECRKIYDEIIVLYRPHMYKELNEDALQTYNALENADKVVLLEIESVKDSKDNKLNSKEFVNLQIKTKEKWFYFDNYSVLLKWLNKITYSNTVILQMGMYLDTELTNRIINFTKHE